MLVRPVTTVMHRCAFAFAAMGLFWAMAGCAGPSPTGTPEDRPVRLEVTVVGTGMGTVTSDPEGIDCGAACSTSVQHGTSVRMTAFPDEGSTFVGWTGCTVVEGTGNGACDVTMDGDTTVGARFDALLDADALRVDGSACLAAGVDDLCVVQVTTSGAGEWAGASFTVQGDGLVFLQAVAAQGMDGCLAAGTTERIAIVCPQPFPPSSTLLDLRMQRTSDQGSLSITVSDAFLAPYAGGRQGVDVAAWSAP